MNSKILNKDFQHPSDGWYQIEPKGEHPNRAAGVVQIIDDEAASVIVNRFNTDAADGKLRHGNELLIDHEHFSDQPDQESRAYGWLQELSNRADGIYGRIRWTATGKTAVDGGDYRFFSTEYEPGDLKVLNSQKRVRPLRLAGLTLTNMNNNRGQKPITNRDDTFADRGTPAKAGGYPGSADTNHNQNQRTKMKTVCSLLGLSADADETSVHAAVTKLQNRVTTLEGEAAPLKNRTAELETETQTLLGEQIDALMDAHGIKADDKVRNRLRPVLISLKNREDRAAALTEFGFEPGKGRTAATGQRVLNRERINTPADKKITADKITPALITSEVRKLMNRDGIKDFTMGYNALQSERPELFATEKD